MKKIMKKAMALLLVVAVSVTGLCISALGARNYYLSYEVTGDCVTVTGCNKDAVGVVSVPANIIIDGQMYQVKYIAEKAFSDCDTITEVIVPEGITSIGSHAFFDCDALREVHIPSTLVICQYDAFEKCADVTVHCYKSNYQFFTVYGFSSNIIIDIIDDTASGNEGDIEIGDSGFTVADLISGTIIETIMKFVQAILAMVGIDWSWTE